MKEKGFTLVELLAVLVILSIIFILVFPSVNKLLFAGKETIYQKQINNILNAAYDFSLKNINYLPESNEKNYITLGELKHEGMIDFDIKDPKTQENFEDNLVISIHNVGIGYDNSNSFAKLKGDYLYTVEIDRNNNSELLPIITLSNLTQDSDGNYLLILNLNENFNEENYNYTATSSSGDNITDKVKSYIVLNDEVVDSINTSSSSVYKINYSVIDNDGYANNSILSVIIADTLSPVITLPKENKISKEETSFDLNNGVICDDNSGYCTITTSGEIDFGVSGKYIITYTGTDPNGNRTTKKRVITIK